MQIYGNFANYSAARTRGYLTANDFLFEPLHNARLHHRDAVQVKGAGPVALKVYRSASRGFVVRRDRAAREALTLRTVFLGTELQGLSSLVEMMFVRCVPCARATGGVPCGVAVAAASLGPSLPPSPPLSPTPKCRAPAPQSRDAGGWGSSKMGTSSQWYRERAPHLLGVSNPPPPPPAQWVGNPPIHEWRTASSKGAHVRAPGGTNRHQPPTATNRQLPTANRQSPPTMAEHMSYTRSFYKTAVSERFFLFPLKDCPTTQHPPPPPPRAFV